MPERNLDEALNCFRIMVNDGSDPNNFTYVGALSACASLGDANVGKEIHGRIYRHEPRARVEWQRLGCKCIPLSSSVDSIFLLRCKYKQQKMHFIGHVICAFFSPLKYIILS